MEKINQILINTFNDLQAKGMFKNYLDYYDWLEKRGKPVPKPQFSDTLPKQEQRDFNEAFDL